MNIVSIAEGLSKALQRLRHCQPSTSSSLKITTIEIVLLFSILCNFLGMAAFERNIVDLTAKLSFCYTNGMKRVLSASVPAVTVPVRGAKKFHPGAFIGFRVEPREQHEREYVSHPRIYESIDPAPRFMDSRVQAILKNLTGCNMDKVFRHRATTSITTPEIVFFTDEQLQESQRLSERKAAKLLMMPPVVKARHQEPKVISYDPALAGLMPGFRTVFTDISLGVADHNRIIVVRDNTGTLREASISERQRMNQIYNPRKYRKLFISELFTARFLPGILERGEYEFVLDRACQQFEPDDPEYQSAVAHVYDAVNEARQYDKLLSTRHYGPMLFYFVWHKQVEDYLAYHLQNARLDRAGDAVRLYCLVHQKSEVALAVSLDSDDPMHLVETFLARECPNTAPAVHLALKQCKELLLSHKAVQQNVASTLGHGS